MNIFLPSYIEQNQYTKLYSIVITDTNGNIPGIRVAATFDSLRLASECMANSYKCELAHVRNEYEDLNRRHQETVQTLKFYYKKYGDKSKHPEFKLEQI
jgi:hypothetical protein